MIWVREVMLVMLVMLGKGGNVGNLDKGMLVMQVKMCIYGR